MVSGRASVAVVPVPALPDSVTVTASIPAIGRTFSGLGSPSPSCLGSQLACTLRGYPSTGVQVTGLPSAVKGAHSVFTILPEVQGFPFTASSSGEIAAIASPVAFASAAFPSCVSVASTDTCTSPSSYPVPSAFTTGTFPASSAVGEGTPSPAGPWRPVGPTGPCMPCSPWMPWGPWAPVAPVSPFTPCGPIGPCASVSVSTYAPVSASHTCHLPVSALICGACALAVSISWIFSSPARCTACTCAVPVCCTCSTAPDAACPIACTASVPSVDTATDAACPASCTACTASVFAASTAAAASFASSTACSAFCAESAALAALCLASDAACSTSSIQSSSGSGGVLPAPERLTSTCVGAVTLLASTSPSMARTSILPRPALAVTVAEIGQESTVPPRVVAPMYSSVSPAR